jgi:hypothetical protein
MIAAPEPEDDGTLFAEPLPYLHHFNEELAEHDHEPLFAEKQSAGHAGYDLTRSFDFRSWPEAGGVPAKEFPSGIDVPESRIRVIGERDGKLLHACYERVDLPIEGETFAEIMKKADQPRPYKWRVTYRMHSWDNCTCGNAKLELISGPGYAELYHAECGRWRKSKLEGPIGEHIMSLHLGMPDDNYNGYYPTVPGNDIAHHNPGGRGMDAYRGGSELRGSYELDNNDRIIAGREVIRGGTEIRGGKAEYAEKTKGLILWDKGTQRDVDRIKKEKADKIKAQSRKRIEERFKQMPPSWTDV